MTQLRTWLAVVANVRTHGTTKERPVDRLAADLAAMAPIAATPSFSAVITSTRLADHDARISYKGVAYSVDPDIITGRRGVAVEVRESADGRLTALHNGLEVANHTLMPSGSPPQDDPRHAAKRRQMRQLPTWERPRGKAPSFDQRPGQSQPGLGLLPPDVATRPLSAYEVLSCRPN